MRLSTIGVAYVIDKELGNCTATPISKSSTDAVKSEKDRNLVRIKTVSELFFENLDYTYVGQVRDNKLHGPLYERIQYVHIEYHRVGLILRPLTKARAATIRLTSFNVRISILKHISL